VCAVEQRTSAVLALVVAELRQGITSAPRQHG
jgi:hypothetical protein